VVERKWTILEILQWTSAYFKTKRVEQPRAAAEILLAHVLGMERIGLYLNFDKPLSSPERSRYRDLILRRASGVPTGYLTGHREFWSMDLKVNPGVLIPRPETEILVEETLKCISAAMPCRILELGTGSGAVALSMAKELPLSRPVATDRSVAVLSTAHANAVELGYAARILFVASNWFDAFKPGPRFQAVVSNPPYVSPEEFSLLPREIREHEPPEALLAGDGGMAVIRHIFREAHEYLIPGGWLLMEIGSTQKDRACRAASEVGRYGAISVRNDYSGLPRVVRAQKT